MLFHFATFFFLSSSFKFIRNATLVRTLNLFPSYIHQNSIEKERTVMLTKLVNFEALYLAAQSSSPVKSLNTPVHLTVDYLGSKFSFVNATASFLIGSMEKASVFFFFSSWEWNGGRV